MSPLLCLLMLRWTMNTKISSPFSGIIDNSYVEIGDYVQPGNVLFSVVDLNPIKIQGYLSESDINKVNILYNGNSEKLPRMKKSLLADKIVERVISNLN